jgi:glycerol-3-phosphate dehydrogenase
LNYSKVQELLYNESGQIHGVWIEDGLTGESYSIYGKKVVNATGPSVDHIREKDRSKGKKTLRMTKGVHLVFPAKYFPLKQAMYFEHDDGRMIFAIPRKEKTYVGTTDTFFNGEILDPKVSAADRHYLLGAIHYMFPGLDIGEEHIESSWAGVRPLIWEEGKNPSEISRKDEVWESKSGLITIAGGKLTGYRKMAELVVDLLVKKFHNGENKGYTTCKTKHYPLSGGDVGGSHGFQAFVTRQIYQGIQLGLTDQEAEHVVSMYGSNVEILFQYMVENKEREKETNLPLLLWAKLQYALDHEMAATPLDFFHRRTGFLLFDIEAVHRYKSEVIQYMVEYFGWSEEQKRNYTLELESSLVDAVTVHE